MCLSNPLFILAQLMGIITFVLEIIAGQSKSQRKILFFNALANIFDVLQFVFLFAWTGAFMAGYNLIRCIIFYLFLIKNKKPNLAIILICFSIIIINGITTWASLWAITAILSSLISTYALWQTNSRITRILFFISNTFYILYCFSVSAITGAISLIIQDIMLLIAIYRFDIKNKNII